jgi:hypothetical protein
LLYAIARGGVVKNNKMKCWCCEKEFEFSTKDISSYIDCEIGDSPIDFIVCPKCGIEQEADYNYFGDCI